MGRLKDKVAIITGGGGGIGRATAIRFAEEGARVIVAEIKTDLGEESAQLARDAAGNSGGDALFIETDVTSHESVKKAISETVERFGKLDILHNTLMHICTLLKSLDLFKEQPIGADVLSPIFYTVVLRSSLRKPATILTLITNICDTTILSGRQTWSLSSFEASLYFIEKCL